MSKHSFEEVEKNDHPGNASHFLAPSSQNATQENVYQTPAANNSGSAGGLGAF